MPWSTLENWSGRLRPKIRRQQARPRRAGRPRWGTALRKRSSTSSGSIGRPSEDSDQTPRQVAEHLPAAGDQGEEFAA